MKPVVKGTSFVLVHTPNIMTEAGTTFTLERAENRIRNFYKELPSLLEAMKNARLIHRTKFSLVTWILKSLRTFLNPGMSI